MNKHLLILAAAMLGTTALSAQSQSTFFLDNYEYSYRLNPAMASNRGFFGLAISNIGLETSSNIGMSSLLFPTSKGISTGFSSLVSADDFLSKLNKGLNSIGENCNVNLLSAGFWTSDDSFVTVELNAREDLGASLPYDVFAFLKKGSGTYSISNLDVNANAFAELALGYTRLFDNFSVGARVKALFGLANVNMNISKADITLDQTKLSVDADASLLATSLVSMSTTNSDVLDFSTIQAGTPGLDGFGAALDLGATYRPIENLELSAAVNDLGFINWKYSLVGKSSANTNFTGADASKINGLSGTTDEISKEIEDAVDALTTVIEFHKSSETASKLNMTNWSANIGARYWMPFYDRLSVGAMYSHHNSTINWDEGRFAVTITPADLISLTANMGANTFGTTWGAAANLNLGFLNLHFSYDGYVGPLAKIASYTVPLNKYNMAFNLGITIMFGESHNRFHKNK